jgi:general stress protein 26
MAHRNGDAPLTHEQAIDKLADLIKDIKFAMLTTVDTEGVLRSRPMATQRTKFDGHLWFFTAERSPKVDQVKRDEHVNLAYADPDNNRYVSVSGTAMVVRDRAKAEELWNPAYKAWFPDGLEDPDLALLRVDVHSAEYWDSPSSPVVHAIGFVKALATGERYEGGENKKVQL